MEFSQPQLRQPGGLSTLTPPRPRHCLSLYMKHEVFKTVSQIQFCPYEDILGIGHGAGFSSILVPGRAR
jgi:hypothetical protein